jgi:uncharacterized protein (DUF488 family)
MTGTVYLVGHSTTSIEKFLEILQAHSISALVDIRTVPKSRHNLQFNSESLRVTLQEAGIDYVHLKELGGLRHPVKDSTNTGWRNLSFCGFADYMQTDEFKRGLDRLISLGRNKRVAVMCAEGNPFRCHRSLVADALMARGVRALYISSWRSGKPHSLTPFAKIDGRRITYPREPDAGNLHSDPSFTHDRN